MIYAINYEFKGVKNLYKPTFNHFLHLRYETAADNSYKSTNKRENETT